jgi:hypothetical protein
VNAQQVIDLAKTLQIKGVTLKAFSNGQTLQRYLFSHNGKTVDTKIKAFPGEHA